jgi:hypothetical protein
MGTYGAQEEYSFRDAEVNKEWSYEYIMELILITFDLNIIALAKIIPHIS